MTRNRSMKNLSAVAIFLVTSLCVAHALASPEVPGPPQDHPIALVGAKVYPVSGPPIEGATVLFDGGKIAAIGVDVAIPEKAERVDARGKQIYPGLIDANSQLGLVEVPTIRGSRDSAETGSINPNVRAEVAFNPDSELIPVARSSGVLTVLTVPTGGVVSGLSACMLLDGWTWEDMCLKSRVGLHLSWPAAMPVETWWNEEPQAERAENRERAVKMLRQALAEARAYRTARQAHADGKGPEPDHDARWESLVDVLDGKTRVFIHAEDIQQIQAALAFAEQEGLKAAIVGGYDAPACAALLKKHNVPVIVGGVYRLPRRSGDAYDAPFTLPARLREAGITFCIAAPTGSPASNVRNVSYHAGTAAAHGLPPEEALKAITLYAAQILGVADRIGSLEVGKEATLIVTTGDPLEIPTHVTAAYIQGRAVSLNDRHKRLWEKYKEKYRRIGINNP